MWLTRVRIAWQWNVNIIKMYELILLTDTNNLKTTYKFSDSFSNGVVIKLKLYDCKNKLFSYK